MRMEIAHSGRTGKDTSITFDTDRKVFCYGRESHDAYIYAEQTRDVKGVVNDLLNIGYKEISREEFQHLDGFIISKPEAEAIAEQAFLLEGFGMNNCTRRFTLWRNGDTHLWVNINKSDAPGREFFVIVTNTDGIYTTESLDKDVLAGMLLDIAESKQKERKLPEWV